MREKIDGCCIHVIHESQQPYVLQRMSNRKLWSQEEDSIILGLIQIHGTTQWTKIASEMKNLTTTTRSSKQIRERWHNQLSPLVFKAPWTPQEEADLFQAHSRLGSKWKQIAAQLSGRTDNAVKNHFYSTVRRALRRLDKHFGFKDSTRKMRDLKPCSLTYFLEAAQQTHFYSDLMQLILTFAQWKPTRQNRYASFESQRPLYDYILTTISDFSQEREQFKQLKSKAGKVEESFEVQYSEGKHTTGEEEQEVIEMEELISQGEKQGEEKECFNYFGSAGQNHSWFSDEREEIRLLPVFPLYE